MSFRSWRKTVFDGSWPRCEFLSLRNTRGWTARPARKRAVIGLVIGGVFAFAACVPTATKVSGGLAPLPVAGGDCKKTLKISLLPEDGNFLTIKLQFPAPPGKTKAPKSITGDPSWSGTELAGLTTEPFYFGECQVIPQGAGVKVRIVNAEQPSKKEERAGVIELQLVEVYLADGESRTIQGARTLSIRGGDRERGKATLRQEDTLKVWLAAAPGRQSDKPEPLPTVFYMCPEHCK